LPSYIKIQWKKKKEKDSQREIKNKKKLHSIIDKRRYQYSYCFYSKYKITEEPRTNQCRVKYYPMHPTKVVESTEEWK